MATPPKYDADAIYADAGERYTDAADSEATATMPQATPIGALFRR